MTEIELKKLEIENKCWEFWDLLPEPKRTYTVWWYGVSGAFDSWHLSDRDKRIAAKQ